jgi:DNA-binding winged helix-turn-helix (wHTH) protein
MAVPMMSNATLSARRQELKGTVSEGRYVCFGPFQVDLQREELFKDGARVHVPAKVYQVLLALIEKPSEIVTREELRARLWPGGTFVNFDANVNTTVNKLRLTLGDSPEKPSYVETIPRQGYCFVGSVERTHEPARIIETRLAPSRETTPQATNQLATTKWRMRAVDVRLPAILASGWAAAVLLCGVLIGIGIVLITHRPL